MNSSTSNFELKRNLRAIFVAVLCLAALIAAEDRFLRYLIRKARTGELGVWNKLVEGKIGADILCVGSSRAAMHFNPRELEAGLGKKCFTLASHGNRLHLQLGLIETYFAHHPPPELLVLGLDAGTLEWQSEVGQPFQFAGHLDEPHLFRTLKEIDRNFVLFRYIPFFGFCVYKGGNVFGAQILKTLFNREGKDPLIGGHHAGEERPNWNSQKGAIPSNRGYDIDPRCIHDLEKIIQLCQRHSTKLLLVYTPEYFEVAPTIVNRSMIFSTFRSISDRHGVVFFDYTDDPICRNAALFFDARHLNWRGAELFTRELAHRLEGSSLLPNDKQKGL